MIKISDKIRSIILLGAGALLMYFSNWNWSFPVATWLFAVFLLRFSRSHSTKTGLLFIWFTCSTVSVASMWKLLSIDAIPPLFRIASGLLLGVFSVLPFLADRLLVLRLPQWVATLIFPCSWTALEYIKALANGSWGALAYTQYGNIPLMQLASVTGIWGISFLISWFASMINLAWEKDFVWSKFYKPLLSYSFIIALVIVYGFSRLVPTDAPSDKVCIASLTNPQDFFERFYGPDWTDRKKAYQIMKKDLDYLFKATKQSARKGARIVVWQEYSVSVMEEKEQEFMEQAKKIAQEENIYLAMAIGLFSEKYPEQLWENKLIWVDPSGNIMDEYLKLKPAPPLEPISPGEGVIPILDTVYGRIASAICADLDYPTLIRHASVSKSEMLVIPAQSWDATDPLHTHMAVFRAVENGIPVFMSTGGGLSIAVDAYGRTITSSDYFESSNNTMIACLALGNIKTVYSRIGDSFAWLCFVGLIILSIWGIFRGKKGNSE